MRRRDRLDSRQETARRVLQFVEAMAGELKNNPHQSCEVQDALLGLVKNARSALGGE